MPPDGRRSRFALLLALAACTAAAFWIADGVRPWAGDRTNAWHHYEYLAEGFLGGHTYLSIDPAPELLALRDPFDPAANAPYRLWDASLYHGRYYLYYGPAPALILMPWKLLTGHVLPQAMAVAVAAAAGFAGLGLLLLGIRQRHFPGLSAPGFLGVVVVAFHAAWLPVILRRPSFWELPIVSAVACLWWALYFLWRYHESVGRARWAVAAGTAMALMMGSRATAVPVAAVLTLLFLAPAAGIPVRASALRRSGLAAAAVAFAGGVALLCYNHARFGRWLEFGQSYQLWGMDERHVAHFSLGYVPFNAWTYLFSAPQIGPYFPFLHPYWPSAFPDGYISFEEVYGVLFMMPVHLAGLAGLAWAWRALRSGDTRPAGITVGTAALSSGVCGLILVCWAGACSRYLAELVAGWTLATSVGLMAVLSRGGSRRGARAAALGAAAWTVACVWLASAEFRGFMRLTNPGAYAAAAHALDAPSHWWARHRGIAFGPVELVVRVPSGPGGTQTVLVASGRPQRSNQLVAETLPDGQVRLSLSANQHLVLATPPLAVHDGRVRVRLQAPWLYPPKEHPFWDAVEPARAAELQQFFSLDWGAGTVEARSTFSNDATALEPAVRGAPDSDPRAPWVESLEPSRPP